MALNGRSSDVSIGHREGVWRRWSARCRPSGSESASHGWTSEVTDDSSLRRDPLTRSLSSRTGQPERVAGQASNGADGERGKAHGVEVGAVERDSGVGGLTGKSDIRC